MKFFTKTMAGALLLSSMSLPAVAQTVPNGGFEGEWVKCVPWTSKNNTSAQGTQPEYWTISNVIGMDGTGKTTVGFVAAGPEEGQTAVQLKNIEANYIIVKKVIPAYMTLGTTWSTSVGTFTISNMDGGSFGGVDFAYTPDAFTFKYLQVGNKATVISYLWKGTWEQADVPGNIASGANGLVKTTMIDRDRCVLGYTLDGCQGGEVTASDDAALIASINEYIEPVEGAEGWQTYFKAFEYKSDATPEKMNIIISADDYFASAPTKGKELTVADLKFLYYSRLSSLKVGDIEVALEEGVYDYTVDAYMPAAEAFSFTALGHSAKTQLSLDAENGIATVTVTNDGADIDGQSSHVYTLSFKVAEPVNYEGSLIIRLADPQGEPISEPMPATVSITETGDNLCRFTLPDFNLDGTPFGDITVENVVVTPGEGVTSYAGAGQVALLEGAMMADVALNGTISSEGVITMNIDVIAHMGPDSDLPVYVIFTNDEAILNPEGDPVPYDGSLIIRLGDPQSDPISEPIASTVIITPTGEGKCRFELPDFALDGMPFGDIVVNNVNVTEGEGVTAYDGAGEVALLEGAMMADVEINGTITAEGVIIMNIDVIAHMGEDADLPVYVIFTNDEEIINPAPVYEPVSYDGDIEIRMATEDSDPITDPLPATIVITQTGDNTCRFELPNFALGEDGVIGDIVLDNVTMSADAEGTVTYTGSVDKLHFGDKEGNAFAPEGITADVSLSGTINATGDVIDMKINVMWYPAYPDVEAVMPIFVTFTKGIESSLGLTTADGPDAPVEYYNLNGQRVLNPAPGQLVIRKQGTAVTKHIVR